jgi:hypothetical protein
LPPRQAPAEAPSDRYFAREADRDLADNPDAPTCTMSEVVAAIFEEDTGRGAA